MPDLFDAAEKQWNEKNDVFSQAEVAWDSRPLDIFDIGEIAQVSGRNPQQETMQGLAYEEYVNNVKRTGGQEFYTFDQFVKEEQVEPWLKTIPKRRGFVNNIKESWSRSGENIDFEIAAAHAMSKSRADFDKVRNIYDRYQKRQHLDPVEGNWFERMFYGGAGIASGIVKSGGESLDEALAGAIAGATAAAVGGQMGPQIATPEEIITVPGMAAGGATVGFTAGMTSFWHKQGTGAMLLEMVDAGYDAKTSHTVAQIAAIPYAAIEFVQIKQLVPGTRKLAQKAVSKSALAIMKKFATNYGSTLSAEVLEEMGQELIQVAAKDVAGVLDKDSEVVFNEDHFNEIMNRMLEVGKESLISMALLPLPGATIDVYTGIKTAPDPVTGKMMDAPTTIDALEQRRVAIRDRADIPEETKEKMYIALDEAVLSMQEQQAAPIEKTTDELSAEIGDVVSESQMLPEPDIRVDPVENVQELLTNSIDAAHGDKRTPDITEGQRKKPLSLGKNSITTFHMNSKRVERLIEQIDGYTEGANYNNIWRPVKEASVNSKLNSNKRTNEFIDFLNFMKLDIPATLNKKDDKGYTSEQRIGVFLASKNKKSRNHLVKGNGIVETDIDNIVASLTPNELAIASWMLEQYKGQYDGLAAAHLTATGKKLGKEENYSPILIDKKHIDEEVNFVSSLLDTLTDSTIPQPEHGMTEERTGGKQPMSLNAFSAYMYNIARTERYKELAPVAKNVGELLNNSDYKKSVNSVTHGMGSDILQKWLKDTVRGRAQIDHGWTAKIIDTLRRRGAVAALGFNIITALKQPVSLFTAMAHSPSMVTRVLKNMVVNANPTSHSNLHKFVEDRSGVVKSRSIEREINAMLDEMSTEQRLSRKSNISQKALAFLKYMDKNTVMVVWKSYYDLAKDQNMPEKEAAQFADKWVSRTQPMANIEDLPQLFRGGVLERLLTTFQNQINQNYNFWAHDTIGAYKAGKIGAGVLAHRVLFSYMVPAVVIGAVSRGGLPKEPEDIVEDALTYPLASFYLIGQLINSMIRGWDQNTIVDTLPREITRVAQELAKDDPDTAKVLEHSARVIGYWKGLPTEQPLRTVKGIRDLSSGESDDIRRLVYSESAIAEKKKGGIVRKLMEDDEAEEVWW